ncbi:MAG: response regulator [Legionellales bacterium]|nr:response regulator [Legionellales bacterium]
MALILLVEDDEFVKDMLSQVLARDGHEIKTASDGEEALSILQTCKPDVLVTDIIMPKKSGTALIKEVKESHPDLKIVAISGGGRSDPIGYLDLSEELGADISFAKPVEPKALLMTITLLTMN